MKYQASKVFVPGGMPDATYVDRNAILLESRLRESIESGHKLITVTGQTKSGKTVLVNRLLPRRNPEECIWLDGGSIQGEADFWALILGEIGGATAEVEINSSSEAKTTLEEFGGKFSVPGVASVGAKGQSSVGGSKGSTRERRLDLSPRAAATRALRDYQGAIVIDDFHYIKRPLQRDLVRALKPLVFDGLPVVLIAIPHRRYDAVRVEREMTGRIDDIDVPSWSADELVSIANAGFPLLNIDVDEHITSSFAAEAYGSPHLMQEFCSRLVKDYGITETSDSPVVINAADERLFRDAAEGTGRVVYDKLALGPRQRSDRIPRALAAGGTTDIYGVVLLALRNMAPGLETIEYEELRASIRSILSDTLPQAHEVTRVLERMAEIATSDESSTPVIDWEKDERRLHITDPFFAFYLKWGAV